jgi:glycosyltransferase involved in cell wall biosynthesis
MRIAQVAPLFESVPPKLYGGTERIVYNLTEALVRHGHDVTLFSSGDSMTSASHVPTSRKSLRLGEAQDTLAPHFVMFEKLRKMENEFDIIHFHTENLHLGMTRFLNVPTVSTMHGRQDIREYAELYNEFGERPMVSISNKQREPVPHANWIGTVYHGLESDTLRYNSRGGDYLAFLGRISPEKGVEHAVEIARRTGLKLKIAAKIEPKIYVEYTEKIWPLLEEPFVEFIGEIGDLEKSDFLGKARATLFPITWPEPFGLVMIESMATGTPVIAFKNGSVPEIIENGKTGFIVNNVSEACSALKRINELSREDCRAEFIERFSSDRMAADYVDIYEKLCNDFEDRMNDHRIPSLFPELRAEAIFG